jgi:AcrR family transcriptional regulator
MYVQGVGATTLDDVMRASGTSKSQFYRYFPDKQALVRDVIALQAGNVLSRQDEQLRQLGSVRDLELWRDAIAQDNALYSGAYGCRLGSLANEVADQDDTARVALARHFQTWESLLEAGLSRMVKSGLLRQDADPGSLAITLIAALQGGYLLAQTAHDSEPMRIALDTVIDHIRSYTTTGHAAGELAPTPSANEAAASSAA